MKLRLQDGQMSLKRAEELQRRKVTLNGVTWFFICGSWIPKVMFLGQV